MCEEHNKPKGTLTLQDFRTKLRMAEFFARGDALTLKDLLRYMQDKDDLKAFGQQITVTEIDGSVHILRLDGTTSRHDLSTCPITGWKYFYATLSVDVIDSDDEDEQRIGLQPRYLIQDKVFNLYRHFQNHPVLQPSIGRVRQQRILLFDGQHKAAALLWNDKQAFECKIYLTPDLRLLNETNISAHDKFTQTRFYSSVMVAKLGAEFGQDFEEYKNLEDGQPKSESGFVNYLQDRPGSALGSGEVTKRFRSYLYNSILQDERNRAARLVSKTNRGTGAAPLTIDMLTRSIFADFLYRTPVTENMAFEEYGRDREISNVVDLMNDLYDLALEAWNPDAGANDAEKRRLSRIFGSKSMMAWSELLKDAISARLEIHDTDERARLLYRELSDKQREQVRRVVDRLVNWPLWSAPPKAEIDGALAGNESDVKAWFKTKGLTTGYLMGANE
jgi:hypothetical protein